MIGLRKSIDDSFCFGRPPGRKFKPSRPEKTIKAIPFSHDDSIKNGFCMIGIFPLAIAILGGQGHSVFQTSRPLSHGMTCPLSKATTREGQALCLPRWWATTRVAPTASSAKTEWPWLYPLSLDMTTEFLYPSRPQATGSCPYRGLGNGMRRHHDA